MERNRSGHSRGTTPSHSAWPVWLRHRFDPPSRISQKIFLHRYSTSHIPQKTAQKPRPACDSHRLHHDKRNARPRDPRARHQTADHLKVRSSSRPPSREGKTCLMPRTALRALVRQCAAPSAEDVHGAGAVVVLRSAVLACRSSTYQSLNSDI